jgi:hypothetical protein
MIRIIYLENAKSKPLKSNVFLSWRWSQKKKILTRDEHVINTYKINKIISDSYQAMNSYVT